MQRWFGWLPLVLFSLYLLTLGARPLMLPDETRYAEISREMLVTDNWIAPRFLGLRYFEKPALGYWLNAFSQQLFGQNNFAVRFASALSAGLSALLLGLFAARISGSRTLGYAAASIYLSFLLVFLIGIFSVLDSMLALCLSAAMLVFYWALQGQNARQKLFRYALFGVCCGLGFLIKGFVALAVPVVAITPFMLHQRRWLELLTWGWVAVIAAALLVAPWSLAVHYQEPDYWRYFFWEEHIKRFSADDAQRKAPFWFFVPVFLAGAMPWTFALPGVVGRLRREPAALKTAMIYALYWVAMPLLFFSISKGKLGTYILPCFAPLALLLALGLARIKSDAYPPLKLAAWANVLFAGGLAIALATFSVTGVKDEQLYSTEEWTKPLWVMLGLMVWAVVAWRAGKGSGVTAITTLALSPSLFMLILPLAGPATAVFSQTPEAFIDTHAGRIGETSENIENTVLAANDVGLAAALAWRFSRSDIILYNTQGELGYGLAYPDGADRYVDPNGFAAWLQKKRTQRDVALFLRLKRKRGLEPLPPADYDARQGRFRLLFYQRQ